jgi:hypothetical protein
MREEGKMRETDRQKEKMEKEIRVRRKHITFHYFSIFHHTSPCSLSLS